MQKFRNFVRGPVGIAILVLFLVPFVVAGFYGYFEGGANNDRNVVAEVNGRTIRTEVLDQRVRQMRAQMQEQAPGVDAALIERFVQPAMVLQGLINNELVLAAASDLKMRVTGDQAAEIIVQLPEFQDEAGRYSSRLFEQFTRARGMTPSSFIQALRGDMLMLQLRAGFASTGFALPSELAEQRRLAEQERDIRYALRTVDEVARGIVVTEDEARTTYEQNTSAFMRPEHYRVAWVELSADQVAQDVTVTDADVEREYEARRAALALVADESERRDVAHIQISTRDRSMKEARARAEEILARLRAGESFAAVAKEMSDDVSTASAGGSLGTVTRGDLPDAMSSVLFSLDRGAVSEPIEVDGHLHIVTVSDIRRREIPAFEAMRDTIAKDLRRSRIQAQLSELALELEDLAYEHPDLQEPAAALGVEVQTSDWMTLDAPRGIAAEPAVLEALRMPEVLRDGLNSELIDLGDDRYVVVRIADVKPAEPLPFAEVRARIEQDLRTGRAAEQLARQAEALQQQLAAGASFDELAGELGSAQSVTLKRNASEPAPALVRAAFRLPRPAAERPAVQVVTLPNGGVGVVEVVTVRDGGEPLTPEEEAIALAELADVEGERALSLAVSHLRAKADIDINTAQLRRFQREEEEAPLF